MKQKILYILLLITTALSWSLKTGAQKPGYKIVMDFEGSTTFDGKANNGTGLNQVSNGVFSAAQNRVKFTINNLEGYNGERLAYPNQSKNTTKTSQFAWSTEDGYSVIVKNLTAQVRAYYAWFPSGKDATANFEGGPSVNVCTNSTGKNGANTVSISNNSGLGKNANFVMKVTNSHDAQFTIHNITFTYIVTHEEEIIHSITITNGTTTTVSAGVDTQGTATANEPQVGYEFLGWDIPNEVTLVSGYTTADKTIKFNASANATVTAKYGKIYDVTIANNVDATTSTVKAGNKTIGNYTIADKAKYEFFEWSVPANIALTNGTAKSDKSISFNAYADNLTITAYFKPVFNFSATATSSNGELGTATATVANDKILGDVDDTRAETTATFTATPADDCIFKGWYEASDYSGEPVSTNTTYAVTLTNSEIGSTASKTLYALFKKKQNLQWADADLDLNLVNGHDYSTAATVTSGKTISYTTDNAQAVTIDNEGNIHAVGLGDAHVTASVPGDDIYQPETITRDFSVGEIKQATFTPAWGEGTSTDIKVDGSTSIGLLNIANDATFTITVGTPGIINVNRDVNTLNIAAESAGTTTLTLSQEGSAVLAGNQVTYTITVSKYPNTLALADETKAMKVDEVWTDIISNQGNNNTQVSYSVENIATYDAETNKITAVAEGSTVITFAQEATATHEGTSKSINVTVTKVVNTLSVTLANTEVDVDGTINLVVSGRVSDGATHAYISDMQLSSEVNNGTDVITYANDVISARNAGTAKIKFTQDATAKYTAYESETYTITVNKISNAITVTLDGEQKNSKNLGRGVTVALGLTSPSNAKYDINRTSGSDDIATISGNTITTGNTDGTNVWEISQSETYKYEAATTSVRIKVNSVAEEEGYVFVGYTGKEETSVEFELSGPGKDIYLGARKSGVGNTTIQVRASTSDSWVTVKEFDTKYSLNGCEPYNFFDIIPENARYVRINGSGSIHHFTDVKVTRKTYVRATATQTNLGEVYTDKTASTTFHVNYSSTNGGDIDIVSNNPRFTIDKHTISVTNHSDNVSDPDVVTITYTPDPNVLGNDEGTITISDRYYSAELTFSAYAKKYPTTITRGSNTEKATIVDGTIDNAFAFTGTSTATPSSNDNDDFYYTIASTYNSDVHTEEGVITYDPATNTITGRNAGTARLTIHQKSTNLYAATSQTFDFTVSKLTNPVNMALSTTSIDVDGTATVALTNDDGKGALSVAYSNISYTNEAQNREGGLLSYNEETNTLTGINAGTATVTVTQAETYKYLSKSQQFNVTVNKLAQALTWDHEVETSMQVGAVIDNNTATSTVGLSPVTYSSSNTAAIEVDAESGRLTAKAVGANITITASQAGNYKYAPATITRQFSVFNKQTPTFTPDEANYDSETKTITVDWEGTATITVTGVGADAEAGFTITNDNNTVISVVRNDATITISGLTVGSTTLTLTQTANDDFLAKTETYSIHVVMPEDYITLDPAVAPTIAAGTYRKVTLNRELKADYSTMALPFNTTVEEIVGTGYNAEADWVAQISVVTYNAHDGYSLFFEKSNEIKANEPYILHLSNAIVNPVFSGTYEVSEATTIEHVANKGVNADGHSYNDWSMHSNYTPNFGMQGKYGVVNSEGVLKLGGTGSTLSAFTAYITGPASTRAKVKAAYIDGEEANGMLEWLESQADGDEMIYDLQGRKLPEVQRGVNIVRQENGIVRKIMKP